MKKYNGSGNAGVAAYEIKGNSIILQFKDGECYLYDHDKPGERHVNEMMTRAKNDEGLTTYVNKYVRDKYKKKL